MLYGYHLMILLGTQTVCAVGGGEFFPGIAQQYAFARAFLTQHDARQIWRFRVGLSLASGFAVGCADAQQQVMPNVVGLSAAAGLSYGLWHQKNISEHDWLDIASAYVVGTFVGRLANKTTHYCVDYVCSTFNKPEARVVVAPVESE